ncbi:4Fe-4S binding protein [Stygiolobus caldivivus]|uniref:4Fe-4S binding protein n=1 Tax=Stygiolobus caldivivus TaxID=2824673 RepID=UPI001C866AFD|nr:4Fe-4S binding protein [Stygiolobus caldivivus]
MRIGLIVTKTAREKLGDQLLVELYKETNLPYIAEFGDYLIEDVKSNELQGLLIVSEKDEQDFISSVDEKLGISPLAVEVLPLSWFLGKSPKYSKVLLKAYIKKLSKQDFVYRLQPVKATTVTRRSLIRFRLYEYKSYPILFDALTFEREINILIQSCPKGLIAKSVEGVTITSPQECSGCGYCTAKGFLGYLEMPNFTTEQFISFINEIVKEYNSAEKPQGVVFTSEKNLDLGEGEDLFPLLIPSVASIHESFVLATYASGLIPVILYDPKDDMVRKRVEEIPNVFPGTNLSVVKVKTGEKIPALETKLPRSQIPEGVSLNRYRRRSLYLWALEEMAKKVNIDAEAEIPGVYYVEVDPEKCVLCGVCVRACQMLVPDMKTQNDLTSLEYNIPYCIGSQRCVKNCPENAIKVERIAKFKELQKVRVNQAKVTKCRYCGKPIGTVKIKGKVDTLLVQFGFLGAAQYTDVCNECKQKELTKMWIENYLKSRDKVS